MGYSLIMSHELLRISLTIGSSPLKSHVTLHPSDHPKYDRNSGTVTVLVSLVFYLAYCSSCYWFRAKGIVPVVCSVVFSKGIEPLMRDCSMTQKFP